MCLLLLTLLLFPSCVFVVDRDRVQMPPEQIQCDEEASSAEEMAPMRSYWMGMIKQGPNDFAEALAASDPAVAAGRLRVDIIEWYGMSGITYPGNPMPDAAAVSDEG